MDCVIGNRYKTSHDERINVNYRGKWFVVSDIDYSHVHCMFEGIGRGVGSVHRTIRKENWEAYVDNGSTTPWQGNILKFRFIL